MDHVIFFFLQAVTPDGSSDLTLNGELASFGTVSDEKNDTLYLNTVFRAFTNPVCFGEMFVSILIVSKSNDCYKI